MTYFLTFLLLVSLFFLIKKQLKINKQNRAFMQLEIDAGQSHKLFKKYVFYRTLEVETEVLKYFLDKEVPLKNYDEVLIFKNLAEHFEKQQNQKEHEDNR